MTEHRPDPEALLARAKEEEARQSRGRLKLFFGAAAGVGKLVLTHLRPMAPAKLAEIERDARADFPGDVRLARDLDEFEA